MLTSIRRTLRKQRYRKDLKMVRFRELIRSFRAMHICFSLCTIGCSPSCFSLTPRSTICPDYDSGNNDYHRADWQTCRQECSHNISINETYHTDERNRCIFFILMLMHSKVIRSHNRIKKEDEKRSLFSESWQSIQDPFTLFVHAKHLHSWE